MNKTKFWRLIETAQAESDGDLDKQIDVLARGLSDLSPEEMVRFQRFFEEFMALAYRWDLRGAAHLINGDCSDEEFVAFRAWLIAQGKEAFENALNDPDTLLELIEGEVHCPRLVRLADEIYRKKTGKELPPQEPIEVDLMGEEWVEEDLPDMFPKLWAEFGEET